MCAGARGLAASSTATESHTGAASASESHTGHDAGTASASESHTKSGKDTGYNL